MNRLESQELSITNGEGPSYLRILLRKLDGR
jgi:hypothetical protein